MAGAKNAISVIAERAVPAGNLNGTPQPRRPDKE
jgi:hypothetical protein